MFVTIEIKHQLTPKVYVWSSQSEAYNSYLEGVDYFELVDHEAEVGQELYDSPETDWDEAWSLVVAEYNGAVEDLYAFYCFDSVREAIESRNWEGIGVAHVHGGFEVAAKLRAIDQENEL